MASRVKFAYRDFYDVPRMLVLRYRGLKLLMDSPFDGLSDEYSPVYSVYLLPAEVNEQELDSWVALPHLATQRIGEIPVDQVRFDPTKRVEIDTEAIDNLLDASRSV